MSPSRRLFACAVLAALASAMLAYAPVALALFTSSKTGGPQTIATATMAAPTNVSATQINCRLNRSPEVKIAWTASSSSYVSSYTIERATASNGSYAALGSVAASDTSYTDSSSLNYSTTYYYRVVAVLHDWSASSGAYSVKTLNQICL
jgi:hypothetical protein